MIVPLVLQVDGDEAAWECVVRQREVRLQACTYASPLTRYALNKCSSCLVVEVCKRTQTSMTLAASLPPLSLIVCLQVQAEWARDDLACRSWLLWS